MTKKYKVAGHVFALELPDGFPLWQYLGQYDPFEISSDDSPLFTVELVKSIPEAERECVYDVPTEDGETVVKLYREGTGWFIEMSPDHNRPVCASALSDEHFNHAVVELHTRRVSDAVFGINNALMLMYAFRTAMMGTLEMHASVISNSGRAFLFLGKSGTGKSTHSSLWLEYVPGSELVNDDNPIVRVLEDGTVMAYGSPWSGKTPCYKNLEYPVGAFVRIRQSPENRIERMGLLESYATIYSSCSGFKAHKEMGDGLHSTLEAVVTTTPCYVLDCRPDREAAMVSSAEVLKQK